MLITVAHTIGSAPREAGTKMIVTASSVYGTIGGGNLEYTAIDTARSVLSDQSISAGAVFFELYALGPMLEQCCGGTVFLQYEHVDVINSDWLQSLAEFDRHALNTVVVTHGGRQESEPLCKGKLIVTERETAGSIGELDHYAIEQARRLLTDADSGLHTHIHSLSESKGTLPDISNALLFDVQKPQYFHIALFGAGHVATALVEVLTKAVSCRINWIDSRVDIFPDSLPGNVRVIQEALPADIVQDLPADGYYLVMTHSHELDEALCEAILKRRDIRFLGLIGSETKKRRFRKRLLDKGVSERQLQALICPIGIGGIDSKEPGSIAVSIAAQLLQLHEINSSKQAVSPVSHNIISF